MKTRVTIAAILCVLCVNSFCGAQTTNAIQIKDVIVSIQKRIVDLTSLLDPLDDPQFVAARKSMTLETAREIVSLVHHGDLTGTQAGVGVLMLSGLKEQTYWVVTEPLLSANTDDDVLHVLLYPPFPYGPGYANAYKIKWYKQKLLNLKKKDAEIASYVDLILSGEGSRDYADYLKYPEEYDY